MGVFAEVGVVRAKKFQARFSVVPISCPFLSPFLVECMSQESCTVKWLGLL